MLSRAGVIRAGYSAELDGIQSASEHAREWIAGLETDRARAHRHPHAQGRLQQGLRLLHRDQPRPERQASRATTSASRRWSNAERYITPELKEYEDDGPHRRGAAFCELESRLFKELCAAGRGQQAAAAAGDGARAGPGRRLSRRWPRWPRAATTAGPDRWRRAGLRHSRRPPPGGGAGAGAGRALRPQRHRASSRDERVARHHRPEHGRQEHVPPPGRADRAAWPRSAASCRPRGAAGRRRPHLHPHRRPGRNCTPARAPSWSR